MLQYAVSQSREVLERVQGLLQEGEAHRHHLLQLVRHRHFAPSPQQGEGAFVLLDLDVRLARLEVHRTLLFPQGQLASNVGALMEALGQL